MAKRSQKIPELREKTELKCKWGLLSIFESCQARGARRKLISNGRRRLVNQQIIEYPRKSVQLTTFDEECQRFQNEVHLASDTKSAAQEQECKKRDHLMESKRKNARKPIHPKTLASTEEVSLNKTTLGEHHCKGDTSEESFVSEDLVRSYSVRTYENGLNEIGMHQLQMSAKALADRLFIERRLKDQLNSKPKSFSNALEVLSSTKSLNSCKNDRETLKVRDKEDSLQNPSFITAPSDGEISVLKPKPQRPKYGENMSCHCSSMQYHRSKSSVRESDSFSFEKMKKRFKHRLKGPNGASPFLTCRDSYVLPQNGSSCYGQESVKSCVNPKTKDKLWMRPDLKHKLGSDSSCEDQEFDVILEAKKHLSLRLESLSAFENRATCKKRPARTLGRVLLSPERDFRPLSPKREIGIFSGSAQTRYGTCNSPPQASNIRFKKQSSIRIPSTTDDPKVVMMNTNLRQEPNGSKSQNDDDATAENSISGCFSENEEAFKSTTSSIIHHLDIADTIKYQEEHQSPVSVLEPIFTDDANSPPSTSSQTDKQILQQPCQLDFGEHFCVKDHISYYVQLVLQASCLNWEYLSAIESLPEETELLSESLFDELDFPLTDHCYCDPKLLFDHINEVLLDLYEVYCFSPPWGGFKKTPGIRRVALNEIVTDKVMIEAEFYILARTERRTLDELVSKDVRSCRSWLDLLQCDTDQILTEISDDVLDESILDILLGI